MSLLLESALDFVRRGGFVCPCQPKTKIAQVTPHGFINRTRDMARVRQFWTKNPHFNIACNAGVIFDVDSLNSLEAVLAFAKRIGLPDTLTVHSGRRDGHYGAQLHFTGQSVHNGPYERDGIRGEVRNLARNLYGLWAGSVHPDSGERYEIVVNVPIAAWPTSIELGKPRLRNSATSASDDLETTAYRAQQTFERLLREARHAKPGGRNFAAHAVTWFAARAFLAEVFEITLDESRPALSEREVKNLIGDAVRPLYHGERNVDKMLNDSWRYGLAAGRLVLDVYWSDLDKIFNVVPFREEKVHRLLDGVASDFPTTTDARDYLLDLLDQAGLDADARKRVIRYSQLDEAAVAECLAELKAEEKS